MTTNTVGKEFDIFTVNNVLPKDCCAVVEKLSGGSFKLVALCLNRSMAVFLSDLLNEGRGQRMATMAIERQGGVIYRGNYSFPNIINAMAELGVPERNTDIERSADFLNRMLPPFTEIVKDKKNSYPSPASYARMMDEIEKKKDE